MKPDLTKLSRFVSLVLRHKPETIGLDLDENGWAEVEQLLAKMNAFGRQIDLATLVEVVETNDKKRFTFDESRTRIRANQGHSVEIDLELEPQTPPDLLLHGTAERNLESIFESGLKPGSRQHVHLSSDEITAAKVGSRHGKSVVLKIDAAAMLKAAHKFFHSKNGVWLTESVPPEFLAR
ncbi:MAG: putative RNA 2'-phosphotransferase [Verrucomicrobiales bacterium]|jgi:putative RNA 2'-phosphotransferase